MADTASSSVAQPPPAEASKHKRATSTATAGVYTAAELETEQKPIEVAKEISKLNWKINTSPTTLQEPEIMKKMATSPPMSKLELRFPMGLTVTARNKKGITIKDCLDVIWKQFRKKADDELDAPILAGFVFDHQDYGFGTLGVLCKKESDAPSKKKK